MASKSKRHSAGAHTAQRERVRMRGVSSGDGAGRSPERRQGARKDIYGGGDNGNLLHPDHDTPTVREAIQRRHARGRHLVEPDTGMYYSRDGKHSYKVPYGYRIALHEPLSFNQVSVRYPFYVTWQSPITGKRYKKYVSCLIVGIDLIATKLQYIDADAYIVSRTVGYNVPPKLRGKFPRKHKGRTYYWCPGCMAARNFRRHPQGGEFYAMKKVWNDEKGKYQWTDRRLALLKCSHCGTTNHDPRFRAANQPYEVRHIKKGVRRVKSRRKL